MIKILAIKLRWHDSCTALMKISVTVTQPFAYTNNTDKGKPSTSCR